MPRALVVVLALAAACAPAARHGPATRKIPEKMPGQTDPAVRAKHLMERFPGVERIDFVQARPWVEPRDCRGGREVGRAAERAAGPRELRARDVSGGRHSTATSRRVAHGRRG